MAVLRSTECLLLKASKPPTDRAQIRKRLPSSYASFSFPWRDAHQSPLQQENLPAADGARTYCIFLSTICSGDSPTRHPGTTQVRKPLFAPQFSCRLKGLQDGWWDVLVSWGRGSVCRQTFLGHSSSSSHAQGRCRHVRCQSCVDDDAALSHHSLHYLESKETLSSPPHLSLVILRSAVQTPIASYESMNGEAWQSRVAPLLPWFRISRPSWRPLHSWRGGRYK